MAALTWNMDFADLDPDLRRIAVDTGDPNTSVPAMFRAAYNERRKVLSYHRTIGYASALDTPADGTLDLQWWYDLQKSVQTWADRCFLTRRDNTGEAFLDGPTLRRTGPVVTTQQSFYGSQVTSKQWSALDRRTFPLPEGFTRVYPREIYRLDTPGASGQTARFYRKIRGTTVTSVPTTHESFGATWYRTPVPSDYVSTPFGTQPGPSFPWAETPDAEAKLGGRLFEHDGTTWVPTGNEQDRLTEVEPMRAATRAGDLSSFWLQYCAVSGDILGPEFLNTLRDAINQMTWSCFGTLPWYVTVDSFGDQQMNPFPRATCVPFTTYRSRLGGYTGPVTLRDFANGQTEYAGSYADQAWTLDFLPNPDGRTRSVEIWKGGTDDDSTWSLWHDFGETDAEDAFGGVDLETGIGVTYEGAIGGSSIRRLRSPAVAVIQKWDGPDGFAYTAAT